MAQSEEEPPGCLAGLGCDGLVEVSVRQSNFNPEHWKGLESMDNVFTFYFLLFSLI